MTKWVRFGKYRSLRQGFKEDPSNVELLNYKHARQLYAGIKDRCVNPNSERFYRYGGRGISLKMTIEEFAQWYCHEVKKWQSKNDGTPSIDRINNDGNYELDNVRIIALSDNTRKMYQDSRITRPHLSKSNVELKGISVEIEGLIFPSILAASRHFGRSVVWVHPRMKRVQHG